VHLFYFPWDNFCMIRAQYLLLLALFSWISFAWPQELHILALQGEGSSVVAIDEAQALAFIQDGGGTGEQGIAGARINDQDVLTHLKDRGMRRISIACSHPHMDHFGGLKSVVKDKRLNEFDLDFVDSLPQDQTAFDKFRLYDLYLQARPPGARNSVSYRSALAADAFATLKSLRAGLRVGNFVYDPAAIGSGVHDASIITHFELSDGVNLRLVVDFDDASKQLVEHWTRTSGILRHERLTLIVSHHGSKHNHYGPLFGYVKTLSEGAGDGLRRDLNIVFAVNYNNKYLHPYPSVLLDAVRAVGPDRVFLTGSTLGDNIVVSATGEPRYASGLHPRIVLQRHVNERRGMWVVKSRPPVAGHLINVGPRSQPLTDLDAVAAELEPRQLLSSTDAVVKPYSRSKTVLRSLKGSLAQIGLGWLLFEATKVDIPEGASYSTTSVEDASDAMRQAEGDSQH
jgi:hypothetical protein